VRIVLGADGVVHETFRGRGALDAALNAMIIDLCRTVLVWPRAYDMPEMLRSDVGQ
jgi:hypothetical protein